MSDSRPDLYLGTAIDGVHLNAEQLNVRSTNLNDLIGKTTYTEALFHILQGRLPDDLERQLFDLVLVAFHGGFGLLPPTTLVPRLVAGTGVSTAQALASGFLASGPYHVGAVEQAMKLYASILAEFRGQSGAQDSNVTAGTLEQFAYDSASRRIDSGDTIGGYGHPLLRKDPRPLHMRRLLCELGAEGVFFDIYDGVVRCMAERKGVPPNVDGMTGAILLHLGFRSEHGTGMFLLARSAAMLAHIIEEQTEMPYQTMRRFMFMPVAMPKLFNTDFKKLTRRFNSLRDSKVFQSLRNTVSGSTRRARQEAADKESADRAVIDEHRQRRNVASVSGSLSPTTIGAARHADGFVAAAETQFENVDTDPILPDELIAGCSPPELLAGAAFFLSSCLQRGGDENGGRSELITAALELVRQAADEGERDATAP